jgi:phosphoglucosamine mutase
MERISRFVKENKLCLGISYDGDGDRCLLTDENGEIIDGDIILAILAKYLKEKGRLKNNTIVSTVMSNLGLTRFAKDNGFELKQTKVGDRNVLEEMLKNDYNLRRRAVWTYYFVRL